MSPQAFGQAGASIHKRHDFCQRYTVSRSYRFHIAQRHALAGAICNGRGHGEDWQRGQVTLAWSFLPPSPINFALEEHLASCQRHRNRLAI